MTDAILMLDGLDPLTGTAETGGDYIQFRTDAMLDTASLEHGHEGRIDLGGRTEKVMLKSAHPHHPSSGDPDAADMLELTLQRFDPQPG